MHAPSNVVTLVEHFQRNIDTYKRDVYKETAARVEFIDPLFEALGWDVRNVSGYSEQYKDVVHEATLSIGGQTTAPDYCFRIGGVRKFFLEAKKPSISLKDGISPAFQLRRYAWSAKLNLSILTDFEEFAVYDCRLRPKAIDKATVARVMYLTYQEYIDKWEAIYNNFSKEAVLRGSFDQFANEVKGKRGTSEVDEEFLKEIEGWREDLARNIAVRNLGLSVQELNFAVQKTIDRIIFLRISEDRGLEEFGRLLSLTERTDINAQMQLLFKRADEKYNAGLFDFKSDTITTSINIDDTILKSLLTHLYYPDSPYEFSVLPADVLGQVYEQFLGKVIRLTPSHRAKVEEKPEVKKAGGVFYTPTFIVNYILEKSLVTKIEGKSPSQLKKIKVLDPACGSGSFLIVAFQKLLDAHLEWYLNNDPIKHSKLRKPALYRASGGVWRLTTGERKRILLNNIYGVDIDRQAVEVTKLSLLLKVLEGESEETIGQQLRLWRERALPDLVDNIKCGNSLISPGYLDSHLIPDRDEIIRLNPFDWDKEFAEIMNNGGFDVVIGNPPYVRAGRLRSEKEYYKLHFQSAFGAYDIFVLFIERALDLVKNKGLVGFITPNKYFVADYASKLRQMLINKYSIKEIADLGKCKSVFPGALISTAITIIRKSKTTSSLRLKILNDNNVEDILKVPFREIDIDEITTSDNKILVYQDPRSKTILDNIYAQSEILEDIAEVRTGIMGFDYWSMESCISDENTGRRIATNSYIDRYHLLWGKKVRIFKHNFFEPRLDPECDSINENTKDLFRSKKIVIRGVAKRLTAMLDKEGIGILVAVHSVISKKYDEKYILGLLNSKLFNWIHLIQFYSARIPEGSLRYPISFLKNLPIREIDSKVKNQMALHDRICDLVNKMLTSYQDLKSTNLPNEKKSIRRQISSIDSQIDLLVFKLYQLDEDQVELIRRYSITSS